VLLYTSHNYRFALLKVYLNNLNTYTCICIDFVHSCLNFMDIVRMKKVTAQDKIAIRAAVSGFRLIPDKFE